MNNQIIKIEKENLVYEVRGKKVMLDSDLAKLYECNNGTKELNQLVKRHIEKFSNEVYFQLEKEEYLELLRSQIVTLKVSTGQHVKYLPYVFSKEGIDILNSLIRNKNKEKIYKKILNDFEDAEKYNIIEMRANPHRIEDLIYEIRGQQVMLDSDLAKLYQCKNGTKEIIQVVKRNPEKFPDRFTFKLDDQEIKNFLVTDCDQKNKSIETRGGKYKSPRVFTEQGVAMLATVLKSDVATKVSIAIMDAFVLMRKYISNNLIEQQYVKDMVIKHDSEIKELQESFNKFEEKKEDVNEVYFYGRIYDAYSKIVDILKEGKEEIIIIDRYADKSVLDMIRDIKAKVTLIVKRNGLLKDIDIEKYNKQYHNLKVEYNDTYHDRYIIIDKKKVYHLGASINHAGSKTFSINILEDEKIRDLIISSLYKQITC